MALDVDALAATMLTAARGKLRKQWPVIAEYAAANTVPGGRSATQCAIVQLNWSARSIARPRSSIIDAPARPRGPVQGSPKRLPSS